VFRVIGSDITGDCPFSWNLYKESLNVHSYLTINQEAFVLSIYFSVIYVIYIQLKE
jgi:hypothetical protein